MASVLHEGLIKLNLSNESKNSSPFVCCDSLEEKMESYIALLQKSNALFDLINTDDHDEIVVRHILDSLSSVKILSELIEQRTGSTEDSLAAKDFLMADIGTGPGLPGIPLACAFPKIEFVLIERMTKRCNFMKNVVSSLGIKNVYIEENQAERLEQNRFDIAVFRAFRPLDKKMTHVLRRILKTGGVLAAYKAKKCKIEEEMSLLASNKPEYEVRPLEVPFLTENPIDGEIHERNLVIIKK